MRYLHDAPLSVRQAITLHVLRPYGKWLGIPRGKMERFTERECTIEVMEAEERRSVN